MNVHPESKVADAARETMDRVKAGTEEAERQIRESAYKAQEKSKDIATTVSEYAQQHPLTALGIALAAGLMLASILKR